MQIVHQNTGIASIYKTTITLALILFPLFIHSSDMPELPCIKGLPRIRDMNFDDKVKDWHKQVISRLVESADKRKDNSDIANTFRKMQNTDLDDLHSDAVISFFTKEIFTDIQENPAIYQSFAAAKKSKKINEVDEIRIAKWRAFINIADHQLYLERNKSLPQIKTKQYNTEEDHLTEFFNLNRETKLSSTQKKILIAYHLATYLIRQCHRDVDAETDDQELLLSYKSLIVP